MDPDSKNKLKINLVRSGVNIGTGNDADTDKAISTIENQVRTSIPPPIPTYMYQTDPAKFSEGMAQYLQDVNAYPAKLQAAQNALQSSFREGFGEVQKQQIDAGTFANDVAQKNAQNSGLNSLAKNATNVIEKQAPDLKGNLDPTTFASTKDLNDFTDRATAYAKLSDLPKDAGAGEVLAWAKNFGQAEGLGEAEGTRNLLSMIGAKDANTRLTILLGSGAKFDVGTLAAAGVLSLLRNMSSENISNLKSQMKFTSDWANHTGTGTMPKMETNGIPSNVVAAPSTGTGVAPSTTPTPIVPPVSKEFTNISKNVPEKTRKPLF